MTTSQRIEARLAGVRFEGLKRVNPEYLARNDRVKAGDVVDTAAISQEAQRMSALQDFDSVGYRLDGDRESPTLTWLPREKNWGPDYLTLGPRCVCLAGRRPEVCNCTAGMFVRGSTRSALSGATRCRSAARHWSRPAFSSRSMPRIATLSSRASSYSRSIEDVFRDDERVARYQFEDLGAQLDVGVNVGRYAQARIGYVYDSRQVDVDIGSPLMPETSPIDAGLVVSAEFDSRDTAFSPTRGLAAALEYMQSDRSLGADRHWERAELGVGVAVPFRRDVLWVTLAGGSDLSGDLPADRTFALGGPGSFPGLEVGELRVGGYWTLGTSYLWKVKDVLPVRNLALYLGARIAGGAIYDRIDEGKTGEIYGGSVFLTGRTLVRPAHRRRRRNVDRLVESVVQRGSAGRPRHDPREGHLSLERN